MANDWVDPIQSTLLKVIPLGTFGYRSERQGRPDGWKILKLKLGTLLPRVGGGLPYLVHLFPSHFHRRPRQILLPTLLAPLSAGVCVSTFY